MRFRSLLLGSLRRRREVGSNALVELLFGHRGIACLADLLELGRPWLLAEHDRGSFRELFGVGAAELLNGLLQGRVVDGAKSAGHRDGLVEQRARCAVGNGLLPAFGLGGGFSGGALFGL